MQVLIKPLRKEKLLIAKCSICETQFKFPYDKEPFISHAPCVCSIPCFIELVTRPKPYTYTDIYAISERVNPKSKRIEYVDFKSYLELRFFKEMSKLNIGLIHYEPFAFRVFDKRLYIPDFMIEPHNVFFETKGLWEGSAKRKFNTFVKMYVFDIYIIDAKFITFLSMEGVW